MIVCADYNVPGPDAPGFDQAVLSVRIRGHKCLYICDIARPEHDSRAVNRIIPCAGDRHYSALMQVCEQFQVGIAIRGTSFKNIFDIVIKEHVIHGVHLSIPSSVSRQQMSGEQRELILNPLHAIRCLGQPFFFLGDDVCRRL